MLLLICYFYEMHLGVLKQGSPIIQAGFDLSSAGITGVGPHAQLMKCIFRSFSRGVTLGSDRYLRKSESGWL